MDDQLLLMLAWRYERKKSMYQKDEDGIRHLARISEKFVLFLGKISVFWSLAILSNIMNTVQVILPTRLGNYGNNKRKADVFRPMLNRTSTKQDEWHQESLESFFPFSKQSWYPNTKERNESLSGVPLARSCGEIARCKGWHWGEFSSNTYQMTCGTCRGAH